MGLRPFFMPLFTQVPGRMTLQTLSLLLSCLSGHPISENVPIAPLIEYLCNPFAAIHRLPSCKL